MFGYLQVQKSELLVREWEAYRSVYCGLCKQMGKDYSFLTRLSLSYDCTVPARALTTAGVPLIRSKNAVSRAVRTVPTARRRRFR